MAWAFVGVSNVVEVTTTAHALVTTGIAGLQTGDLLVACISSRIASTTPVTLPAGWTLVGQRNANNVLTTTSAAASATMAYHVRGASDPALTFTHPVAPTVAIGRIVAYRGVRTALPFDVANSFVTAINITAVSGAGLTTAAANDLIVTMTAGGQEAAWSAFNATTPAGASGATSTAAPTTAWLERADTITTTGADTSLGIFDAIKAAAGATGNFTATASLGAVQSIVAGAFRIFPSPTTLDPVKTSSSIALSGGNLIATRTTTGTPTYVPTLSFENGPSTALYAEATFSTAALDANVGISNSALVDENWIGESANSIGVWLTAEIYYEGVSVGNLPTSINAGNVIAVRIDTAGQQVWFRNVTKAESWWPSDAVGHPVTLGAGPYYFGFTLGPDETLPYSTNFSGPFAGVVPSGFTKWDGTSAAVITHYTLTAVTGAVVLTRPPAITRYAHKLIVTVGAFALTGFAAVTRYAHKLIAASGTIVLSGKVAILRTARILSAQPLTISVTGVAAALKHRRAYVMAATVGAVVLTGFAAALSKAGAVVMLAAKGTLTLTGLDVVLRVESAPVTHYTLAALPGMFVVSGQAAALSVGRVPPVPQFEILQFGRPVYHMPGRW